ncbi:MAG TPA: S8 family peptidase [Chloroflexota bacterium]|nr:S8 family peptidase [Chloroflexota bacterium]
MKRRGRISAPRGQAPGGQAARTRERQPGWLGFWHRLSSTIRVPSPRKGNAPRWLSFAIAALIALSAVVLPSGETGSPVFGHPLATRSAFAAGLVLVRRKPGVSRARLASFAANRQAPLPSGFTGVDLLHVPAGQEQATAARLRQSGDVVFAEPDYRRFATLTPNVTPNDPLYSAQWALPKIDAPTAWQTTLGSANVTVAVIDTGFDLTHPDRPVNLVAGPTFVSQPDQSCAFEDPNVPYDDEGHGTHVGGIIAAATNNGIGVAGLAPGVSLLVIKAGDCTGSFLDSDIAAAIQYATDHGARVINMSFGGTDSTSTLADAIQYAASKGVMLVAAAGNDGSNEQFYPASYSQVLAIAASNSSDGIAWFSNWGPQIAVAAPGVGVLSTIAPVGQYAGQDYYYLSGTSMASPHVAAIAGLILSAYPSLTTGQVVQAIEQGAMPLGPLCPDPYYGYGRVNAADALNFARQLAIPATSIASTDYAYHQFFPLITQQSCRLVG